MKKKIKKNEIKKDGHFYSVLNLKAKNDFSGLWDKMKEYLNPFEKKIKEIWKININKEDNNKIIHYTDKFNNNFNKFWN